MYPVQKKQRIIVNMKYTDAKWKKKNTVKTYSKSRPCQHQRKSLSENDDVFDNKCPAATACLENNKDPPLLSFEIIRSEVKSSGITTNAKKEVDGCTIIGDGKIEIGKHETEEDHMVEIEEGGGRGSEVSKTSTMDDPKNSTCIEGGARIESPFVIAPAVSPIAASKDKTDLNTVSMELTFSGTENQLKKSTNLLSSVAGSSPYILAALTKKKSKSTKKHSILPFIRQRLRENYQRKKTTAVSPERIFQREKEETTEKKSNVEAEHVEITDQEDGIVPESECENDDVVQEILDCSSCSSNCEEVLKDKEKEECNTKDVCDAALDKKNQHNNADSEGVCELRTEVPQICSSSYVDVVPLDKKDLRNTSCSIDSREHIPIKKHLKTTPRGSDQENRDVTPEDKDHPVRLKNGIRRSLYVNNADLPVDILLHDPVNLKFKTQPSKLKGNVKRLRRKKIPFRCPIDILLID